MKNSNISFADRIKKARNYLQNNFNSKPVLLLAGLLATIWFLVRVIPKPSRAGYPCMRAAAPLMSGFILYILAFTSSFTAIRHSKRFFREKKYKTSALLMILGIVMAGSFFIIHNQKPVYAFPAVMVEPPDGSNNPMGEGRGIHPGRVIWAWNPDATNPECRNIPGDAYWDYKNNDTTVIRGMIEESITELTGTTNLAQAWDSIFTFHNRSKNNENRSYQEDETIFIKINQGTAGWLLTPQEKANGFALQSSGQIQPSWRASHFATTETGPFVVLNILRQLINVAGVPQENIYIGDPMAHIYDHNFQVWFKEFPEVNYADKTTDAHDRTFIVPAMEASMQYSDKGEVLKETNESYFEEMELAAYMINVACLKSHVRAGITLTTKNHFGSITRSGASHIHPSLVSTSDNGLDQSNTGYKKYRAMVDIMGHKYLGGNTMLFIVEGLFGGSESEVKPPRKWNMAPFNGHWSSSLFMSLDQVALESVCYDFLRTEYNGINQPENYPNWDGVDDYLHQSADPANWPEGIEYNPDGRGVLGTLGVHEHWDNATNKQYSRNLGMNTGIELKQVSGKLVNVPVVQKNSGLELKAFPNPFTQDLIIAFDLELPSHVELSVYSIDGRLENTIVSREFTQGSHQIKWQAVTDGMKPGSYFLRLIAKGSTNSFVETQKIQLIK